MYSASYKHAINSRYYANSSSELSVQDAEVVVMVAFGVLFMKEVSRSQLQSAAKSLLSREERKRIGSGADKSQYLIPLANALRANGIIEISGKQPLSRNGVKKIKPF